MTNGFMCVYCGFKYSDNNPAAVIEHVLVCEKRPEKKLIEKALENEAKLQATIKGYELALNEIFKAYPEDIMPDTTQDDRDPIIKQYPGFIDRTSAMMGRHIAKVIRERAAHFANEILEEERHDDEPEWVCEICGSDYLEHQVGHYDHLYKGPLK